VALRRKSTDAVEFLLGKAEYETSRVAALATGKASDAYIRKDGGFMEFLLGWPPSTERPAFYLGSRLSSNPGFCFRVWKTQVGMEKYE
jgi:hypothetical protein